MSRNSRTGQFPPPDLPNTARLMAIFKGLHGHFGPRHWWPAETPFEVVVGAILTQNTAWCNVEYAIVNLRTGGALTPAALLAMERSALEALVRPAGYFRQKAARLQGFAGYLQRQHHGNLQGWLSQPLAGVRTELLTLPGIGPETADSILLYAGNRPTFVVDAYTRRLFGRLHFMIGSEPYDQIRALFMDALPADAALFNEFHALIVQECKTFCRKTPRCLSCPLHQLCPSALFSN